MTKTYHSKSKSKKSILYFKVCKMLTHTPFRIDILGQVLVHNKTNNKNLFLLDEISYMDQIRHNVLSLMTDHLNLSYWLVG